jgi:DHA3 family macrolide efflux protein-like MFS transporter
MYPAAIATMAVLGLTNATANGPIGAILQTKIPPEMQGRIFMVGNSMASAASPLGLLLAGPLADKFGLQVFYISAGLMCVGIGVFFYLNKRVYTLDDQLPGGCLIEPSVKSVLN